MKLSLQAGKAVIIQCNVADFDACKEFIETVIKEQGRIDILVNNAGITKDGLLMKMSEEDFDKVLDTNLKGTFHTIRAALRQMIQPEERTHHKYGICCRCQR